MAYRKVYDRVRISQVARNLFGGFLAKSFPDTAEEEAFFADIQRGGKVNHHIGLGEKIQVSDDLGWIGFFNLGGKELDDTVDESLVKDQYFFESGLGFQEFVAPHQVEKPG
jgi:hypothetical protein